MNIKNKKIVKYLIAGFVGFIFMITISNINEVYAAKISARYIDISIDQTNYKYDGKSHKPKVYAYYHGSGLTQNQSYTVTYPSNTVNSGLHTITVKFIGNYTGTKTIQYRINGIKANEVTVSLNTSKFTYNGKVQRPKIYLYCRGIQLSPNISYTLSYDTGGIHPGAHTIKVNLKGNYEGSKTIKYTINKANINNAVVYYNSNLTYDGQRNWPDIQVKYNGKHVDFSQYSFSIPNSVNVGTYSITLKGNGDFYGTKTITYKISPKQISNKSTKITVNNGKNIFYDNTNKPTVKVVTNGKTLQASKDYSISYSGNANIGIKTVTITGKGNYKGSLNKEYRIYARPLSSTNSNVRVSMKDGTNIFQYTGKAITPKVTTKYITGNNKTITLEEGKDYILSYSNNVKEGTAKLTMKGINNFTSSRTFNFKILKFGIDVSEFQGKIDWKNVAKTQSFALIRAGGRKSNNNKYYEDKYFKDNIEGAQAAGLKYGVYFYSTAHTVTEAKNEAEWLLKRINGYNITYPVMMDYEDESLKNLTTAKRTEIVLTFLNIIQSNGYKPMFYGEQNWINMSKIKKYDFCLAFYPEDINGSPENAYKDTPNYNDEIAMWQYTSKGKVNGISGNVDKIICYKKY